MATPQPPPTQPPAAGQPTPTPLRLGKQPQQQQQTPEQIAAAVATRQRQLRGKPLEPVPGREIQVGQSRYALPTPPPDWENMLRVWEKFSYENQHSAGWEQVSGPTRKLMESIGGAGIAKALQWVTDIPVVGQALGYLQRPATQLEGIIGYTYQSRFDPDLNSPEAIWELITHTGRNGARALMADPDPLRQKVGAALLAGQYFYETSGEGTPLGALREGGTAWIQVALRPSLWVTAYRHLPTVISQLARGEPVTLPPKLDAFLKEEFGIEDWGAYVAEQRAKYAAAHEAFITGSSSRHGGLPELIGIREKLLEVYRTTGDLTKADMERIYGEWAQEYGALAFEGQMNDVFGSVILDPLNLLPPLKVKDWIHATRSLALLARTAPEVVNAAAEVSRAAELVHAASVAEDAAVAATRAERVSEAASKFVTAARAMGLEDFTKVADEVETLLRPAETGMRAGLSVGDRVDIPEDLALLGERVGIVTEVDDVGRPVTIVGKDGVVLLRDGVWATDIGTAARVAPPSARAGVPIVSLVPAVREPADVADEIATAVGKVEPLLRELDSLGEASLTERIVLALTGGDPFNPNFGKIKVGGRTINLSLRGRLNPLSLSAAARADDFVNTIYNSIHLIMKMGGDDVAEIARNLKKAAAGAFGGRFGHMILSPIGRHVQAVLKALDLEITDLLAGWAMTEGKRVTAGTIGRMLGTDIVDVVVTAGKGKEEAAALFRRLADAAGTLQSKDPILLDLAARVRAGEITAETLEDIGITFKSTINKIVPYTPELFRAAVIARMGDVIADMAKAQFGLRGARWIEKAVQPIKAVESLILLGFNPLYPVKNFLNNEVTIILRGLGSTLLPSSLTRYLPGLRGRVNTVEGVMESFGVNPARFHEGLGIAGPEDVADLARGVIDPEIVGVTRAREAIRDIVWGKPGRISGWVMEKARSIQDFRRVAQVLERMSSERAFAMGMLRAWPQIWPKVRTGMEDFMPGLATRLDEWQSGLGHLVDDVAASARRPEDLQRILSSKNIRINLETVLRQTAEAMGVPRDRLTRMIPEETVEAVRKILEDLGPKPSAERVDEAFRFLRGVVQDHVDELVYSHMEDLLAEAVAKVESEGPPAVASVWGQVVDRTTRRHYAHMERLDDAWERILAIKDKYIRNRAVSSLMEESERTWARHDAFSRTLREAMVRGMRGRGREISDDFLRAFDDLTRENRAFFRMRNELMGAFWRESGEKSFDDFVTAQARAQLALDEAYAKLIDTTDAAHARMDAAMLDAIYVGDDAALGVAREWRDLVRGLRRSYMEDVLAFRKSIRGLPEVQKKAAWLSFHQLNRRQFLTIKQMEDLGQRAMRGDQVAVDFFQQSAASRGFDAESFARMKASVLSGTAPEGLSDAERSNLRYWQSRTPMTPQRRRLLDTYGRLSDDLMEGYFKRWSGEISDPYTFHHGVVDEAGSVVEPAHLPKNIHEAIFAWAYQDKEWKDDLIRFIEEARSPSLAGLRFSLDDIVTRGIDDLPPPLQERMRWIAGEMMEDIGTGEPGRRVFVDYGGGDKEVIGLGSSYPEWYGTFLRDYNTDKGAVLAALEKILAGGGADKGVMVERLKRLIVGELRSGPRGYPPDPDILRLSGAAESEVLAAQDAWRRIDGEWTSWIPALDESVGPNGIPSAITQSMKQRLVAAGFTPAEIAQMGPQDAWRLLTEATSGEAARIQDLAQHWLYENGFVSVPLYGGNLRVYRGLTRSLPLDQIELRSFDSLTAREDVAARLARGRGPVFEFEIPTENIFTHHKAHPAFAVWNEAEFILNERGYDGARLVSIDGRPPTQSEMDALRKLNPGLEFGPSATTPPKPSIDFDSIVGRERYDGLVEDDMWFEEAGATLDEIEAQVRRVAAEPVQVLDGLPPDLRGDLTRYFQRLGGDLNDARLASVRMAEALRDSALLNYNRRYNFDNWAAVVFPFPFWWTHNMIEWSLSVLERPQILASYAKTRQFLMNAQTEQRGFPSRLRGRVKIDLPFAPAEFGEAWVDPFSVFGLPFEQLVRPFEQWKAQTTQLDGRVEKKLREMAQGREVSEDELQAALSSRSGPVWERARSLVLEDDESLNFDLLDFMNLSVSPHVPVTMLANIARGEPEQIGVMPLTRTLRNVASLVGIDPGVYDRVWGNVRKAVGLPAFDQYDEYRIERELSTMAGENLLTAEDAVRAMIERRGKSFDEARRRTERVQAAQWGYSLLGLPVNFYPPGEEHLRDITPAFFAAMDQNEAGNPGPLRRFFENYPEYEARLALWRKPEDRLKQFLADQIYSRYYDMPDLNRREIRDALGDQFVEVMLDRETRNPDSASVNVLAMWLRQMGGEAPGMMASDALPVPLTRPDIAKRLQAWYDFVDTYYPSVWEVQQEYFRLDRGEARAQFKAENPVLQTYWDERKKFMYNNPDLAPYLEEDPQKRPTYPSAQEYEEIVQEQPQYTWDQWVHIVSRPVANLVLDYYEEGLPLPQSAISRLQETADRLGLEGGWRAVAERMSQVSPVLTEQ